MEPFITDGRLTKDQWAILSRKLGERFQCCYRMEFNPVRVEAYSGVAMPQRPFANYGQSEKLMGVSVEEGRNRLSGDQIEECGPFNDGLFYWLAFPEVLRMRYLSFPGSDYKGMSDTSYAPAVGFDQTFLMGAFGPEVTLKPVYKAAYGKSGLFTRGKVQP